MREVSVAQVVAELHRAHYSRLLAPLVRLLGGFEAAEDVVQDAFAQALRVWGAGAVPDEPLAWLRRVAKNRAIDAWRRRARWQEKEAALAHEAVGSFELDVGEATLRDDTLRLLFTCCHPALAPDDRVALTLRTVCGLTSDQVARAFLLKGPTLQQRLVRVQRKIDQARIPYVVPERDQLPERLAGVLRAVYLVFNEGYGASDGDTLIRHALCDEGIRLGRLLAELLPDEAAPQALLALMLLHHARRRARLDAAGELVTLDEQDRSLWDRALIADALPRVEIGLRGRPVSTYAIEAAIAALHIQAPTAADTDWPQIAALYRELEARAAGSPVVALNAAVARALAGDLAGGLSRLEALAAEPRLGQYHLLPAAQGDLLRRAGQRDAARAAYARALALVVNPVERRFLERRLAALDLSP